MPDPSRLSSKEYKRAFSLAKFILSDSKQADDVALRVTTSHEKELKKQIKNRKVKKHPKWTRVLRNTELNLDILTYIKSTVHEKRQESSFWNNQLALDDRTMVIRFIKQIILDGLKRNSAFLNVGLARLIFFYPYSAITDIQQQLKQSPDELPDEDRYRKQSQVLVDSLRQRFSGEENSGRGFLKFEQSKQHREGLIVARDNSISCFPLVEQCLTIFTPPAPACPNLLGVLGTQGDHPADGSDEHALERERMHAVLCPPCFYQILSNLDLAKPEDNLRLPLFTLNDGGGGNPPPPSQLKQPQKPTSHRPLGGRQVQDAVRRSENLVLNQIVIAVDDEPRETINLQNPQSVRLKLTSGDAIVEALTDESNGNAPLALIYLDWDPLNDVDAPAIYHLKLDDLWTLEFLIAYEIDEDKNKEEATVTVSCTAAAQSQRAAASY